MSYQSFLEEAAEAAPAPEVRLTGAQKARNMVDEYGTKARNMASEYNTKARTALRNLTGEKTSDVTATAAGTTGTAAAGTTAASAVADEPSMTARTFSKAKSALRSGIEDAKEAGGTASNAIRNFASEHGTKAAIAAAAGLGALGLVKALRRKKK